MLRSSARVVWLCRCLFFVHVYRSILVSHSSALCSCLGQFLVVSFFFVFVCVWFVPLVVCVFLFFENRKYKNPVCMLKCGDAPALSSHARFTTVRGSSSSQPTARCCFPSQHYHQQQKRQQQRTLNLCSLVFLCSSFFFAPCSSVTQNKISCISHSSVSYTHLTLPTNREV